jgi:hypothetical protein
MTATSVDVKDAGKSKTKADEKAKTESKAMPEAKKPEAKTK